MTGAEDVHGASTQTTIGMPGTTTEAVATPTATTATVSTSTGTKTTTKTKKKAVRRTPFVAIALLLAACPGPRGTSEPSGSTMPPATKMQSQQPAAPAVNVQLTEYAIEMPDTLTAGMHTFMVTNAGTMKHNFAIDGPGVMQKLAGDLMRGDSAPMTVMLQKGTYTIYCPVDGHRGRGMSRTITVQ